MVRYPVAAFLCSMVLLCLPWRVWSQCPGVTTPVTPFATEQLAISDVARPLTQAVYKPSGITPNMAAASVRGATISYNVIGTPTDTNGHEISGSFFICGYDSIIGFKAIRITTDAVLTITYYKPR